MAWMAGCAWTDVFFANSAPDPSGWLAAKDGAVALMLTGLAVAWMVMHGDLNEAALGMERSVRSGKRIDRSHVENHFVVYSASFFVGWSWVVLLRDLAAVSGQARIRPVSGDYLGGVAHLLGFDTVQNVRAAEYNAFARSLLGVIVFGPVLTVLTIYLKGVALRVYGRAGGTRSLIALGKLYAKARDEDAEIETRYAPRRARSGAAAPRQPRPGGCGTRGFEWSVGGGQTKPRTRPALSAAKRRRRRTPSPTRMARRRHRPLLRCPLLLQPRPRRQITAATRSLAVLRVSFLARTYALEGQPHLKRSLVELRRGGGP